MKIIVTNFNPNSYYRFKYTGSLTCIIVRLLFQGYDKTFRDI